MIQKQISTENANDGQLKQLYETAFPKEELRGKGLGQKILNQLIERYKGQSCVLDMESPRQECDNEEQRLRRHEFYLRNGFRDTSVYRCWDDLEMTIMMIGPGEFTLQDWD